MRSVHARPGTLRKAQAAALSGPTLPLADSAESIRQHFSSSNTSVHTGYNGVKSHDCASSPVLAPLQERYPQPPTQPLTQALPSAPSRQVQPQPAFDTIRQAPQTLQDKTVRVAQVPPATLTPEQDPSQVVGQQHHQQGVQDASYDAEEQEYDDGNIMHSVVLPVLDSVRAWSDLQSTALSRGIEI